MLDRSIALVQFTHSEVQAQSPNFRDDDLPELQRLLKGFGSPAPDDAASEALFIQPLRKGRVAVARVRYPKAHFLILSRQLYDQLHDPFAIAECFPVDWEAKAEIPDLEWPAEPLPPRTVEALDIVLREGDGPFLYGALQALVDGGKIILERPGPDPKSIRDLWALLPASIRRTLRPATFAFSNDLQFDILAMPSTPARGLPGYLNEDQARDYPDSRYERQLQLAIETNDQGALDRLLARKSTNEMIRLALFIIAGALVLFGLSKFLAAAGVL